MMFQLTQEEIITDAFILTVIFAVAIHQLFFFGKHPKKDND